ncbi:MAG: synthase subunit [Rhodospirillales bacterium]|nr:synthase subunit [Rhodospirillales bacterium]
MPFEIWEEARAREIIAAHATESGSTLRILHALQEAFGFIPEAAIPLIAEALNLSRAEIHGVVTFYHDFRRELPGRHVLKLCRAEACQSMGGDALGARARAKLGVNWGETTRDGRVTLDAVFCLGLCATAPSAMINNRLVGRLTQSRLDALIEQAQ